MYAEWDSLFLQSNIHENDVELIIQSSDFKRVVDSTSVTTSFLFKKQHIYVKHKSIPNHLAFISETDDER